ncbi:hypothetical protein G6F62_013050 [Rhizopus arrhizus]|nr:hypothetical protein G6F62_013050 [Rhizopus arrhizus]
MLQRALGRGVGWISWRLLGSRRRAAEVNLQLCFPEKDEAWRQRLVRDSFDALGVGVFECIRAWWGSIDRIRPQVQIEGLEHLRRMQAEGRGVLLVSGHFMTLEMCGRLLCDYVDLSGMYRKHKNPVYEWAVKFGRLRYAKAMYANEDIRATVRHLKKGGFLWYAPDQDMRGKDTVFVPFFGVQALTMTLVNRLAERTGATVLYGWCERIGPDMEFALHIEPTDPAVADPDPQVAATALNAGIERIARRDPAQYQWTYKRYTLRPAGSGEEDPYATEEHPH